MATNHTANYQLNLWEAQDKFLREEFNENTGKVDAALGALAQTVAAKGNCRIISGTYKGAGKYGKDHPTTLTFDGKPLFVAIMGGFVVSIFVRGASEAMALSAYGMSTSVSWGEKSITFYNTKDAQAQSNNSATYHYIALLEA